MELVFALLLHGPSPRVNGGQDLLLVPVIGIRVDLEDLHPIPGQGEVGSPVVDAGDDEGLGEDLRLQLPVEPV